MSKENRVVTVTDKKSLTGIGNLGSVGGSSGGNAGQQGAGRVSRGAEPRSKAARLADRIRGK